jgi:hypothetical protein
MKRACRNSSSANPEIHANKNREIIGKRLIEIMTGEGWQILPGFHPLEVLLNASSPSRDL